MADNETIADIIAEMRQGMNPNGTAECQYLESDICMLADRLEAANKRERGDAAKLREALKRIVAASIVAKNANAPEWILQRMADVFAMATTALAAPPRNCDKYANHNDAMNAFDAFVRKQGKLGFINLYTESFKWLFAPVTEQEGGKNGNE